MRNSIDLLLTRYQQITSREQLIVLCTSLVVIWALWDNTINQPLQQKSKSLQLQINAEQVKLNAQQLAIETLTQLHNENTGQQARIELTRLNNTIDSYKKQLSSSKQFASPIQMTQALRDILDSHGKLKLIKLENLPASPFPETPGQPAWVYRHGLNVTFRGTFFATLDYLQTLQQQPWRINWSLIDYQVTDYPTAETTLQIYTLSFEETWLAL